MGTNPLPTEIHRRAFGSLTAAMVLGGGQRAPGQAPAVIVPEGARPAIPCGVSSGDVNGRSGVVWSRTDRPARMFVEWSTTASFRDSRLVGGSSALPEDDFTARVVLPDLPSGQTISYRVTFRDLASSKVRSLPAEGSFRTAPGPGADVSLAWGGDTAGQGWGIDPARGGMAIYEAIRNARPDVFLHSGDHIYADNPIVAEVPLDDGSIWRNLVTEETSKVAETLAEFRGRYRYNFARRQPPPPLCRGPGPGPVGRSRGPQQLVSGRSAGRRSSIHGQERGPAGGPRPSRLLRVHPRSGPARPGSTACTDRYGMAPSWRSSSWTRGTYRGPNTANVQAASGPDTAFLGPEQLRWLKARLKASTAKWKVIASDMPIGLIVRDGPGAFEAAANADPGPPLGRELEVADLLRFLKAQAIRNVVWLTADVHYAAAHRYDPDRAKFTEFDPFWEFVAGPLHAGTFGPGELDATFGPRQEFCAIPRGMKPNRPPSDGHQFFGVARVAGKTSAMTVTLHDRGGKSLYSVELPPEP